MESIYIKNGFPRKLIQSKIRNLKGRNFQSVRNSDHVDPFKNSYEDQFNLILQYTSKRCDTVAKHLIKTVKRLTPKFRLSICWRTVKLSSIVTPRLKNTVPLQFRNGCIYEFTCAEQCNKRYIGESKRLLKTRINEHFQDSKNKK